MAKRFATKDVLRQTDGAPVGTVIKFNDGRTVELRFEDLTERMMLELAAHGANAKVGDSYSGCGGNMDVAIAEAKETVKALLAGDWNRRGGEGGILAEALARVTGKPMEEVIEALNKPEADKTKLQKNKKVKAAMAAIRAERLAAQVTDDEDEDTDIEDLM